MENAQKVYDRLDELNISYEVVHHKAVFTIEEMEQLEFPDGSCIVKNLFLRDDKGREHYLVVVGKDKKVDLKNLKNQIGSKPLSFASEERLQKYLGLGKGAVSPLGIINDAERAVKVVIDKDLTGKEKIGVHPNDNTATVLLSFSDLIKIIELNGNTIIFADI